MWQAIISFLQSIFGLFKSKEDRASKKESILNQPDFVEAEKRKRSIERTDQNEKLVSQVGGKDKRASDEALEEIRKRLGK